MFYNLVPVVLNGVRKAGELPSIRVNHYPGKASEESPRTCFQEAETYLFSSAFFLNKGRYVEAVDLLQKAVLCSPENPKYSQTLEIVEKESKRILRKKLINILKTRLS